MCAKEVLVKFLGMPMDRTNWQFHMPFLASSRLLTRWKPTHMFGIFRTPTLLKLPSMLLPRSPTFPSTINSPTSSVVAAQTALLESGTIVKADNQWLSPTFKNPTAIPWPTSNGRWPRQDLNVSQFQLTVSLISGIQENSKRIEWNPCRSLISTLKEKRWLLVQLPWKTVLKLQASSSLELNKEPSSLPTRS